MNELFVDGGVIKKNPSTIGGTWAARLLRDDLIVCEVGGAITPAQAKLPAITNNLTEMLAMIRGLQLLPVNWTGTIYSDSQVTLGRVVWGWKWQNIPPWLHKEYQRERRRLAHWEDLTWTLLDGHPTKAQLAAGIGKRGHPVNAHNVWCDKACQAAAAKHLAKIAEVTP
jgi:ribonuclease HI